MKERHPGCQKPGYLYRSEGKPILEHLCSFPVNKAVSSVVALTQEQGRGKWLEQAEEKTAREVSQEVGT